MSRIPNQSDLNHFVTFLFTLQMSTKLYHWNTLSYARHMATDRFMDKLNELTDRFVETFIGKYNIKPLFPVVPITIELIKKDKMIELYKNSKDILKHLEKITRDTDLLGIRDDLLSYVEQTIYLFRLQ